MLFSLLFATLLSSSAHAFPQAFVSQFADLMVAAESHLPQDLQDPALFPATNEFGPTVISLASLPYESELVSADTKPWSSHWFPKVDRILFDDGRGTSPLEKYDLVRATISDAESKAANFEAEKYRADAPKWEGLCDAWAIASLLFPEPKRNRSLQLDGGYYGFDKKRVTFSVGDQKALLLKSVEALSPDFLKVYGQKFKGDFDGWIYPDLFPQELHRFVEKQIFEKKQPFVMDHDPGVEVWNEPVYKSNYTLSAVPGRDDAVFVRLWLYSASPLRREEKDQVGTKDIVREYNYTLYGKPDGNGNLVIDSGVWEKGELVDSRRDHPDYVFTIPNPEAVKRASYNPEFDPAVLDQIIPR